MQDDLTAEEETWIALKYGCIPQYKYIHKRCGGPAFLSDHLPAKHSTIGVKGYFHINYVPVKQYEAIVCGTCNIRMFPIDLTVKDFKKIHKEELLYEYME